ncbi:HAD family hydrolase [Kitasatospora sp. NPDC051705]|uniref:HAD family hydrolase n=1 Tax=Kitasatospora sp. NPDC051705 TaxID=3364057 RepID=UPI0037B550A3
MNDVRTAAADGAPAPVDLHLTVPELTGRLLGCAADGQWLDAFLLSSGVVQVVEDVLEGTAWRPRRLLDHLAKGARPGAVGAARAGLRGATGLWLAVPPARGLRAWCGRFATLRDRLAELALQDGAATGRPHGEGPDGAGPGPTRPDTAGPDTTRPDAVGPDAVGLVAELRAAVAALGRLPGARRLLAGAVQRPPACFRSFDQHPQDCVALARLVTARHPDRHRPLLVLGVRTSGSHLAPLLAAALRGLGHGDVVVGTTRPGAALLPGRAALVRELRRRSGLVLLVDDPPVTGGSLAGLAGLAVRGGFAPDSVVPVLASFDDAGALPPALRGLPCVTLPGRDWHVRTLLGPTALAAAVARLLPPGRRLLDLTADAPGPLSRHAHLAVPCSARVVDPDGGVRSLPLLAEWAGVGYFGSYAATVAGALAGLVPEPLGIADGVLVRPRPEHRPADRHGVPPAEVARYVAARQRLLAVPADRSLLLAGRDPVWEASARQLAPVVGRLHTLLRPLLLDRLTRTLLTPARPCVTDGLTARHRWTADGADGAGSGGGSSGHGSGGGWRKTAYADGAFGHLNLASYDAVYDLAGAAHRPAPGTTDPALAPGPARDAAPDTHADATRDTPADQAPDRPADDDAELLAEYRRLTGEDVSDARWCLLRLVQARHAAVQDGLPPSERTRADARRAQARAVQRFLSAVYLADLDTEPRGPCCVLDVDGVLESDVLGFPASSPAGALALRALRAHGYRTVLATGRSGPEVADRCAAYRLDGGVAEYGAVLVDAVSGSTEVLLDHERRRAGDGGLRARLAALDQPAAADPLSRWCVRASVRSPRDGRRHAPEPQAVAALLAEEPFGRLFTTVPGQAQTDFVPRGCGKAPGARALLARLGADGPPALAVGDGVADVELLGWAGHGAAPANAERAVRAAGVPVTRRAYQAGLAEAVGRLIGHRPGGCPLCRAPRPPADARALLAVLAVPEAGRSGAPLRLARLAVAAARTTPATRTPRAAGAPRTTRTAPPARAGRTAPPAAAAPAAPNRPGRAG